MTEGEIQVLAFKLNIKHCCIIYILTYSLGHITGDERKKENMASAQHLEKFDPAEHPGNIHMMYSASLSML